MAQFVIIVGFDSSKKEMAVFFNGQAFHTGKFKISDSKIKHIRYAKSRQHNVGFIFDSSKVTDYRTLSDFMTNDLKLSQARTERVMNHIIGFSCSNYYQDTDTLH
jgi:hypothetical protein